MAGNINKKALNTNIMAVNKTKRQINTLIWAVTHNFNKIASLIQGVKQNIPLRPPQAYTYIDEKYPRPQTYLPQIAENLQNIGVLLYYKFFVFWL